MAAWGYEFYLPVLKVYISQQGSAREDKIRIPKRPCNILYISNKQCQFGNCL